MNGLNEIASDGFTWLMASAWQAGVITIIAAIAINALRRHVTSQLRYAILFVALLKFAMPPFVTLPTGLLSQTTTPFSSSTAPERFTPVDIVGTADVTLGQPKDLPPTPGSPTEPSIASNGASSLPATSQHSVNTQATESMPWQSWVMSIYLLGTVVFMLLLLRQLIALRRVVRNAIVIETANVKNVVRDLSQQLGLRTEPSVMSSRLTDAPFATGLRRPMVVLPSSMINDLPAHQLRIVIAHELSHIRRKDLLVGWLEVVLGALWWFHPGMWWLKKSLRRTREECCDDMLVAQQLADPERYCETLISAAACQTYQVAEPIALGFANGEHPASGRIRRLMDRGLFRSDRLKKSALFLLLIVALTFLPGMQQERAPVSEVNLTGFFGAWKNIPFDISAEEEQAVKECVEIANLYFHTRNAGRVFDNVDTKIRLEEILKEHPKLFYAEYLLATWHRNQGNDEESERLFQQAIENAPVVLTRKYAEGTGEPLARVDIERIQLECNRVRSGSLDTKASLSFVGVQTNDKGIIHLPAYDTVFRISGSYPRGYRVDTRNMGWFRSTAKFGKLPDVLAWQQYSRPRGFKRSAAESSRLSKASGTTSNKIALGDNVFTLGSVSRAAASGQFVVEDGNGNALSAPVADLPGEQYAQYVDHVVLDLATPNADQFDVTQAFVLDSHTKIDLDSFQSGAGMVLGGKSRFHVCSFWEKLPESLDLLLQVHSYPPGAPRAKLAATVGASAKHDGVTVKIKYLQAGNHHGWSSATGFYGEPHEVKTTSEMMLTIKGHSSKQLAIWVVRKNGRRTPLKDAGYFSPSVIGGPIRIHAPLDDIAFFELLPYSEAESIYFEDIQLPKRPGALDGIPVIEFPINGVPQEHTADILGPMKIEFQSLRGRAYSGIGGNQHGITFTERDPDQLDADTSSTVTWRIDSSAAFEFESEFVLPLDAVNQENGGRRSSMFSWGGGGSAGIDARRVPLESVKAARLYLYPKQPSQ